MANKTYLDKNGLTYFWSKIKSALTGKQDTLVSGTNIKTINNTSLLGSGNILINDGVILWTNDSPSSSMKNASIVLSSDDYDILEVYYKVRNQNDSWGSCRVPKGCQISLYNGGYYTSIAGYMRTISRTDDTHFNSGACFGYNKDQGFEDNAFLIPVYIVGYKTNMFN